MNSLMLATALLLQAPAAPVADVNGPARDTAMAAAVASVRSQTTAAVGADKVQHFMMSYTIAAFAYGAGRAAGMEREPALTGAMAGTLAAGVAKELFDARSGGDPSFADLLADVLGAAAAYVMLRQVR